MILAQLFLHDRDSWLSPLSPPNGHGKESSDVSCSTLIAMNWKRGDRVKVKPTHYGTGMQKRLGTVFRTVPSMNLVEVDLDSFYLAGIGITAFKPEDLMSTNTKRTAKRARLS